MRTVYLATVFLLMASFVQAQPSYRSEVADLGPVKVYGCNEIIPGMLGIMDIDAPAGYLVQVAVNVETTNQVRAFNFDVEFPSHLIYWVRTDFTGLASGFEITASGIRDGDENIVASSAITASDGIPAGMRGALVVFSFITTNPGEGSFEISHLGGHIAQYEICSANPVGIEIYSWGMVKANYK
jgi:hypothetical protein